MSAKAVRGEKVKEKSVQKNRKRLTAQTPVHEKLHFTAPVAEMNQLELALNVLRLSKEWKVSFSDICEAANVAQRIRDAVK